jgi:phosphoribosylformimino-5-aminoimidazole carboxamide ribotide isomerase
MAMRVIGVLDLHEGRAVHARAGARETYAPVAVADSSIAPGDALALARLYLDRFGLTELYVADLDAITTASRRPATQVFQDALVGAIAAIGVPIWLDAGVSSVQGARRALAVGASHVIIGLETLQSFDALAETCSSVGTDRVAFSLDLRSGQPLVGNDSAACVPVESPTDLAARAADAGAGHIIVIDLARVGLDAGLDFDLITRVRGAVPGLTLLAGGGVRGVDDLARLAEAGCNGALVATAIHQGHLGPADVAVVKQIERPHVK